MALLEGPHDNPSSQSLGNAPIGCLTTTRPYILPTCVQGEIRPRTPTQLLLPLVSQFGVRVGGTKSRNTHYFAKSQNQQGLKPLPSGTKFVIACSFTKQFKKTSVRYPCL